MGTIDFDHFRSPVEFFVRSKRCRRTSHGIQRAIERYRDENQEEQQKWLNHVRHILRETFPFLKDARDLTNLDSLDSEPFLTRTVFYRGLVIPGVLYKFNFTLPSEEALGIELKPYLPFDYRIKDHLYVKTAGRFDLELFKHAEHPTYQI